MTNEEIRKRFEFDMNIGLFLLDSSNFITEKTLFKCSWNRKLATKFLEMLSDSGYSLSRYYKDSIITLYDNPVIALDQISKIHSIIEDFDGTILNEIPDYIKEYK